MSRIKIKSTISEIEPYVPGTSSHDTGRPLTKMSSNENPYGPSPLAVRAIREHSTEVNRYPDKQARDLKEALSDLLKTPQDCIYVGNGSDDLLQNLAKLFLSEGQNLVTHSPFSTYKTIAASMGAERRLVGRPGDLGIDVDSLMDACDKETRILLVCTPNNPTGTILGPDDVDRLVSFTSERRMLLVVDEAYYDFSDQYQSPANRIVPDQLDLVVTRTFSKAYGLAGLRIGYGIATSEIVRYLDLVRMPFNASSLAQEAAIAGIKDREHFDSTVKKVKEQRDRLSRDLESIGLEPAPSEANFLLVSLEGTGMTASEFTRELLNHGYAIRDCTSFQLPRHVRITVGTPEMNQGLVTSMEKVLSANHR